MRNSVKRCLICLIAIILLFIIGTKSQAFFVKELDFNRQSLKSTNIYGVCKIYDDDDVFYYKKSSTGVYSESTTLSEVQTIRNSIKQAIDSLESGEYLISKILNSNSYYDETNKEFCFKRDVASVNTDTLTKVIIIGYDDNYQFKSNLTSNKGAYKVKKVGGTEEFYVSYDDTWVESELSMAYDATSIKLDKTSITLEVGDTAEVKYTVLPDDALNKNVTVSYSDGIEIDTTTTGVVKITAISEGDAYIIVKLKSDNTITAKCDIKIGSSETPVVTPSPTPSPTPSTPPTSIPSISPSPIVTTSPIPITPSPEPPIPTEEIITSNKYTIDADKKYISRVTPKINITTFKSNIESNVSYKMYSKNGEIILNDDKVIVATGMKLKTETQEYTIIVKGDIDGNGKISINDVVKCNLYTINIKAPDEIEKMAADVNGNGKVTITDLVKIKLASLNIKDID